VPSYVFSSDSASLAMAHYREILYRNYSATFGSAKVYDPDLASDMYDLGEELPELAKDAPIADIGCGKGEWLSWMKSHGFTQLRGFDISPGELSYAKEIPVESGDVLSTLASAKWHEHFSLIHAKDFIEHLTKQETTDFLLACRAALRDGGFLMLSTFNGQSMFSTATRYGDFTHESALTPSSMAQILRATEFAVERIHGMHNCPNTKRGFLRKWIWRVTSVFARLLLRCRHGGAAEPSIDTFSVDPDLFALARKNASKS
jgi:2-polyprenyl-3-methyl-5-hydroxy-6-metoxy-1,4-benzoquinol methylase